MSNEIKRSINDIEIPEGAEERMYANILKKGFGSEKARYKDVQRNMPCGCLCGGGHCFGGGYQKQQR